MQLSSSSQAQENAIFPPVLPFSSNVKFYTMTQSEAAHPTGARLLWRLDTKGSLVSIPHYSSSLSLVSSASARLAEAGEEMALRLQQLRAAAVSLRA